MDHNHTLDGQTCQICSKNWDEILESERTLALLHLIRRLAEVDSKILDRLEGLEEELRYNDDWRSPLYDKER